MRRSSQPTKEFGVNILRGWRSPLLAYPEKLALCRWGIRDGLDIIAMLGFTVVLPNLQTVTELLRSEHLEKLLNMKTNIIIEKKFDALKMMREIRDKIDKETKGMSFTQLKEYYKKSAQLNKRKARSIPS